MPAATSPSLEPTKTTPTLPVGEAVPPSRPDTSRARTPASAFCSATSLRSTSSRSCRRSSISSCEDGPLASPGSTPRPEIPTPTRMPSDEREEDRRERRDVVAEVEQRPESRRLRGAGLAEGVQPVERLAGKRTRRGRRATGPGREASAFVRFERRFELELHLQAVARELEREPPLRLDGEHEQLADRLRPAEERRLVLAGHLPARAGGEPAAVGLDAAQPRPPVGRLCGSATKAQTSSSGASSSRDARTVGTRKPGRGGGSRSARSGGAAPARRGSRRRRRSGRRPRRARTARARHAGEKRRETPFASTRISPTFSRVTNVDDIPARSRSRNSIRLKCVPTATMSSAPFSKARSSAMSSLIPGIATTW